MITLLGSALLACSGDGEATGPDGAPLDDTAQGPLVDCPPAAACSPCAPGPSGVDHVSWYPRLTASPPISWTAAPGVPAHEVALGTAPGLDDIACWRPADGDGSAQFLALWVLVDGETYFASVRGVGSDGTPTEVAASTGWTVDIVPPAPPAAVDDTRAVVDGTVTWTHDGADQGSGFSHFELAVGTAPGLDDALAWADVGAQPTATVSTAGLAPETWFWASVRAVDVAGNASIPTTSDGFITCPPGFAFAPGDDEQGTAPFCVARYEMRIEGRDDGDVPYDPGFVAESRASGTPWVNVDKSQARIACDALGFGYQLISNAQWQTLARSAESVPGNWSGGAVGSGFVPRGHSDEAPLALLSSDGDPCTGTGNPSCEDPGHADFRQRRTHALANGEAIWDLAGNAWEQVDGSVGGPEGLWMDFDAGAFTTDPGWEDHARHFAPAGPHATGEGMGRMYGGDGNLVRGGSYDPPALGGAGSAGADDVGLFAAHHNTWWVDATHGFRCVFWPM